LVPLSANQESSWIKLDLMTQLTTYYSLHSSAKIFYSGTVQTYVYFITD
jgi:hypothetical protein